MSWRLAVIEELITENDRLVRAAIIRTSTCRTNRSIVKLYLLEVTNVETTVIPNSQPVDRNAEEEDSAPILEKRPLNSYHLYVHLYTAVWLLFKSAKYRIEGNFGAAKIRRN